MKKISMRYLTLGNIFGYFAKSLAIMFMVALIGCTSSSTDDSDDNTPPQEQPSNPDDGDDNSGGGSGSSDNNEQISMEEMVANVESAQEVIDPLFEQCETIDDLAKHLDEIKAMECVSEVEIEEETLFIILKGGLRIGWSYHEFPLDSAEDDENGEEYSSYTPATSATSSQIDVVTRAEQRDEHKYISDVENIAIINLTGSQNAYESALRKMIKEYTNLRIISNTDTTEEVINTINSSHIIWLMTHGMLTSSKHWFLTEYVFNIPEDISKNYHEIDDEFYLNDYYSYRKSKNSHTMWEKYVSETYLQKVLRLQNDAIVFCGACYSLKNNDNIATIFKNAGAIAYLGYDDGNAVGYYGGGCFIENLLRGQTINEAYQNKNMNDFKEDHWWNGGGSLLLSPRGSGGDYCIVHPKVKTIEKPEVEGTSATLEGVIEEWNGNKLLEGEVGFCWSKDNSQPTIKDKHIKVLDISNSDQEEIEFDTTIEDLEIATEYYYRSYLYINDEYWYGEVKCFETDNDPDAYMRAYLIKLYNDTNGDNWDQNTNWCSGKPLVDWYGVSIDTEDGKRLYGIHLSNNNLQGAIDLSGCTALEYLSCKENQLTSIDVSGCTVLHRLYCYDNKLLTYINASECIALKTIDFHCTDNQPIKLDISGCSALTSLKLNSYKYKAQLASIDASRCISLRTLICYGNQLTSLDVSGCTALDQLECYKNQLTNLNVSGCTALRDLYCGDNQLTSLDVSGCSALRELQCWNNQLVSLNVSGCTSLIYLRCQNNKLTGIDVSGCSKLLWLYCENNKITAVITKQLYELHLFVHDWLYVYGYDYDQDKWVWTKNEYGWYYPGEPSERGHLPPESWYK